MVDRIGHYKLMLIGSAGLTIIYGIVEMAYASGVLGLPVLLQVLPLHLDSRATRNH